MDLKKIIRMAITEEDFFRDFYRAASEKTTVVSAKNLLLKLSSEEKVHKEKLQTFDFRGLKVKEKNEKEIVGITKPLMLTPIDEFNKIKDIFDFAAKSEIMARERYSKLSRLIDDDGAKWLFNFLVVEEKKHEKLLMEEMRKLSI